MFYILGTIPRDDKKGRDNKSKGKVDVKRTQPTCGLRSKENVKDRGSVPASKGSWMLVSETMSHLESIADKIDWLGRDDKTRFFPLTINEHGQGSERILLRSYRVTSA